MWSLVVVPSPSLPEAGKASGRFRPRATTGAGRAATPTKRVLEVDQHFWAEMPGHRWLLDRAGWPKDKPRHSTGHEGWQLQFVLSIFMCGILAVSLFLIH